MDSLESRKQKLNGRLAELLSRCANGDTAAFRALYDAASPQLFASLLRILRRRDLAEDALQDVLISVWRNADSYRSDKGQPMTWMTSIARYRALDIVRRQHRERNVEQHSDDAQAIADISGGPFAKTESAAAVRKLEDCMDDLSREQSTSIRLAYLDGYTHGEIATRLRAPLGTAKSWIRRGLQALKDCLER
ncbi:MAG: sigma-70 family RNA polymerase sigma factor [Gammaproteobacteria bacterium]|nr:sigma-70 family RNA polymerase sigma factor [Gammaproteobacteria bacterium]